ncbi:hypothetical protein [Mucilaginibacter agri]|uniref:Uncharacterized protein n=1 Tax=Mucilaginibacter agri TaxID=2695265 RepID=A0A965ZED7_9SPHI|nr:hypothetical protein [Mucilaginibacter agri]NCD68237.1 hypothetical protein [Mucilaginibacter agri]
MPTIWVHLTGYNVTEYLPVKTGKYDYQKFWMQTEGRVSVREGGENYLNQIAGAEYEFSGKVVAEMAINETVILVIDVDGFQFYISNGRASDSHQTINNFGKMVKGKGRLSLGVYPYEMGVQDFDAQVKQIVKVTVPEKLIIKDGDVTNVPLYLSPDQYTETDTQLVNEITDGNQDEVFYLVQYEISE